MKTTNNATQFNHSFKPTSLESKHSAKRAMTSRRQKARLALLVALALVTFVSAAIPAAAADDNTARPAIKLASLAGKWQSALFLDGGCGVGTKVVTFTLNASGTGKATEVFHTPGCGDNSASGTFTVKSLNTAGTGTAQLSVTGGLFNYIIQVAANGQIFNMVDVTDPGNYEVGTSVKQ
jgi:hypothetical protein